MSLDRYLPLATPIRMAGPVVKGFGRGSKMLGIPTANLDVAPLKLQADALAPGIYFGWASVAKSDPRDVGGGVYRMVMSIGWNPFFDNSKKTIEPWLLHTFERDFYEQELRITVLGYVRPEANFTTIEDLISGYTGTRRWPRRALRWISSRCTARTRSWSVGSSQTSIK